MIIIQQTGIQQNGIQETRTARSQPELSALVIAHNEQAHLAACLERLDFADELVVMLDRCSDSSVEIASAFTANLHEGAWEDEGVRRMAGRKQCKGRWILEIDADERVTPALALEIRAAIESDPDCFFLIPVDNYIGTRLV
ncbi:MAG: glycosyltransferase, partial [Pseudomonadota bacterium]